MASYFMLLTAAGQTKLAAHMAGGDPLQIVAMAVGDGGGSAVTPTENRAALLREVHRQALTNLAQHGTNSSWVVAETVLAPTVGGWWIREVGLFDVDGDLVAYGNFPDSYKPLLSEGSGKELIIRTILEVSSTAAITLIVDSSIQWATQAWVLGQAYATQAWVAAQAAAVSASNLGAGTGQVFANKSGSDLRLRSIKAGSNVTVTQTGTEITVAATAPGETNTASNLGAGQGQIFASKTGVDLKLRSIKAGSNVTVSQTATEITVAAATGPTEHHALMGLEADDHPQYLTAARGDTRYAPITMRAATTGAAHVRIPGTNGDDWMIQKGTATAPATGTYATSKSVVYPFPFKPGTSPAVSITPIMPSTLGGPLVAVLSAPPTATAFTALFDVAEGDSGSANIGSIVNFQWVAQGIVDDSGWLSGAEITYTAAAGTPATATVSVAAGTYTNGVTSKDYSASTVALTGAGGDSVTYYLYYADPAFTGGTKTLNATTDATVPFSTAGNIVVGQVLVAYPASGTGDGGGSTGGGGGGSSGGACPSVDAFVISRTGLLRAGAVRVGDELLLCDPVTGEEAFGTVTHSAPVTAAGCRVEFGAGALTCSTTAPIPTEAGYLPAPQTPGHSTKTRTLAGAHTEAFVAAAPLLGEITVQHITVGDRCFWAGDDGVHFLLHHNLKNIDWRE